MVLHPTACLGHAVPSAWLEGQRGHGGTGRVAAITCWVPAKTEHMLCMGLKTRAWAWHCVTVGFLLFSLFFHCLCFLIFSFSCYCLTCLGQQGWDLPGPVPPATIPAIKGDEKMDYINNWCLHLFFPPYFSVCLNKRVVDNCHSHGWQVEVCVHLKGITERCTAKRISISCHLGIYITLNEHSRIW